MIWRRVNFRNEAGRSAGSVDWNLEIFGWGGVLGREVVHRFKSHTGVLSE